MNKKKILITGVTGSLGSSLAAYFIDAGYDVFGSVRKSGSQVLLPMLEQNKRIEIDLNKEEKYHLPEELSAVIHCAASTSEATIDPVLSWRVNVGGTARLLEACRDAKVKRFIFISTMSANPENPSNYAQTKLEAERIVRQAEGIEHVILRPGLIISPNSRGIFHKMKSYVEQLPVIPIIGNNPNLSTVSMDDLCKAVELSVDSKEALDASINVCADESISINDIVRAIASASGRKVRCMTIPYSVALFIAAVSAAVKIPILTKDNVYGLKYARAGDTTSLKRILEFEAQKCEATIARQLKKEGGSK